MKFRFAVSLAFSAMLLSSSAFAGPSSTEIDELFSNFGFEAGGFFGATGSFKSPVVSGGDAHVVLEAAPGALLVGARFGSDLKSTQFAMFDAGVRYFFDEAAVNAWFVGGGGFYGSEFVNSFKFEIGNVAGAYGELGYEMPRDSTGRVIFSVRGDVGGTQQRDISRIEPEPVYGVLSLNLTVLVGGNGTKSERPKHATQDPKLEEVPLQ